ncbi:MAG: 5-formyltetrahydrofolate cyclo-ligase [Wolbachia endosymbiont of Ctenocephalides orientis wCori]|nr:MAG: 5-formyltetrahydrofolate cyclo-ligase [Wolbachia endosymbiont of Ctenocephalides orientis wCori]
MLKDVKQQKNLIREQYRAIRKNIDDEERVYAADSLIRIFNQNLSYIKGKTIAAYIPIDGEINVIPLVHHLLNLGYKIAIPSKNKLLKFEEWNGVDKDLVPDTIITPMIAFDHHFNRLGFGEGWYDRTIEKFHAHLVIGVAYEKQYCKDLPIEEHDQKLDMIITETCARLAEYET